MYAVDATRAYLSQNIRQRPDSERRDNHQHNMRCHVTRFITPDTCDGVPASNIVIARPVRIYADNQHITTTLAYVENSFMVLPSIVRVLVGRSCKIFATDTPRARTGHEIGVLLWQ